MPELVSNLKAKPIEYVDAEGNRLDVSRYVYQPYPRMLYRADGQTKIVKDKAEHEAAGPEWAEKPFKRPIWDTRKAQVGFVISENHLEFLKANGYEMTSLEEAKAFFDGLPDEAKDAFLTDAANWIPAEPKKRGPGRPPKTEQ